MKKTDYTSVRIQISTRKRLAKIVEALARSGWSAVGSDRTDVAGISSVLDYGLVLFEERLAGKKR